MNFGISLVMTVLDQMIYNDIYTGNIVSIYRYSNLTINKKKKRAAIILYLKKGIYLMCAGGDGDKKKITGKKKKQKYNV